MENLTLYLFCLSLYPIFITSAAVSTISATQTIKHGETIISAGGNFELGFFSPENSDNQYLGIWYKNISDTVVWVANREFPLINSSGVLKFKDGGILILLDHNNRTIWSANTSRTEPNPVAELLDSGNLVIRNENDKNPENFLWESFDYPGNTFLPGMKIGSTGKGMNLYISSWKSVYNPSQGNFTMEVDSSGLQVIVKQGMAVKGRSGMWNGLGFSGNPNLKPNNLFNSTFVSNLKEKYYTYELLSKSIIIRMVLEETGNMQCFKWNDRTRQWMGYLVAPVDKCDTYGLCGVNGVCSLSNSRTCGCFNRFVPKNPKNWDSGWADGCVRRTPLDCQKGDGFIKYSNIKLPDMNNYSINSNMNLEECCIFCLKNCSCVAYANSDIRGSGSLLWFGDLVDIKQVAENGQDIYIRMASSEIGQVGSNKKKLLRITVGLVSSTGMLVLVCSLSLFIWKKKALKRQGAKENNSEKYYCKNKQKEDLQLPNFEFSIIAKATNNFSINNKLGEGGFGLVYKGILKDGQEIAVKRLSKNSTQGLDEFKNEVMYIAKLQHRNLVKLLGYCCIQEDEKLLIYEFLPNKSLDIFIFDQTQRRLLDWPKRYHIINGIARGLLYLHQDSRLRIIHRDLKASNVLLDSEMNPKISDFGLARSFGGNETGANTKKVVGTYGYMSPEYAIDGLYSVKSDVFSFGVMVLEIVSGQRNRGFYHPEHHLNLLGHAWTLFSESRYTELIDTSIIETCNLPEVVRSVHVGLLCVQRRPDDRPSMWSVVRMLDSEGALPQPKQPGFFSERDLVEAKTNSPSELSIPCSTNGLTITILEAR